MRIAYIVNSFPEVSEKFFLNQVIGLKTTGVDITIIAAHRSKCLDNNTAHIEYYENKVADYTVYLDIPRPYKKRLLHLPSIAFKLLFISPKAFIKAFNFIRYKTAAKNLKNLWFGLYFSNNRFDLVHCQFGPNGLVGSYLKECGFCKNFFVSFHGSDINTYPSRYGKDVYRYMYKTVGLVTVNTRFTGNKVEANGCPKEKIRVQPVGLIPAEYADISRDNVKPHTLLTVGRLVEKKGHKVLMQALPTIIQNFPHTRWHIAGDGHLRNSLTKLAQELQIESYIDFLGQCDSNTIKNLYATASIFILPSTTAPDGDMEGQGLVLQEAQCCGMPVVTTLHNGIPDGVLDGKSGFLVPENNPEQLAKKIMYLFKHHEIAINMGIAGKHFVQSKYDVAILAQEMKSWYEEFSKN